MEKNQSDIVSPEVIEPFKQTLNLLGMSVWEIELSVRVANIVHGLNIVTIHDLLKLCCDNGRFVGLKGVKGAGPVVNYEIASKLVELGVLDSLKGLKVPAYALPCLSDQDVESISQISSVDIETKLLDLNWTWQEYALVSNNYNNRGYYGNYLGRIQKPDGGASYTIKHFILQFLRVDVNREGVYVLRTWDYSCIDSKKGGEERREFLRFVREKLTEWNVPFKEIK